MMVSKGSVRGDSHNEGAPEQADTLEQVKDIPRLAAGGLL